MRELKIDATTLWRACAAAGLVALGLPTPLAAQTCLTVPAERNEIWIAGEAEWGGDAAQGGALFAANVLDVVGFEVGHLFGGYEDHEGSPSTIHVRALPLLRLGGSRVCPFVEWRYHDRKVRQTLDVTHGNVSDNLLHFGAALAGDLPGIMGSRLGWQATTGLTYRDWDLSGRRTVVSDSVYVEQIRSINRSLHFSFTTVLTMRVGSAGLVMGVGRRPRSGDDFLAFVTLGFRVAG